MELDTPLLKNDIFKYSVEVKSLTFDIKPLSHLLRFHSSPCFACLKLFVCNSPPQMFSSKRECPDLCKIRQHRSTLVEAQIYDWSGDQNELKVKCPKWKILDSFNQM